MKKWTTALSTSIVTLALLASASTTEASTALNKDERTPIYVAVNEQEISKERLIQKLRSQLPEMFISYKDSDFQMTTMSYHYADDLTTRYELMFQRTVNKKTESGSVTFSGDNLDIEGYYFNPISTKDALFPGKITEAQAKSIATEFVKKVVNSNDFVLASEVPSFYSSRLITEPITYTYSYTRTEKNIPIQNQGIYISVLADGTIQYFSQMGMEQKRLAFEDQVNLVSKDEAIAKFKEQLNLTLQYTLDYSSGKQSARLVYLPITNVIGLHATSNKWATNSEILETTPVQYKLEPLASAPLKPVGPITTEQAKEYAKQLVEKESKNTKFTIDSAYEYAMDDQEVISISYSYLYKNNSRYSASIEFNKKTGELISYSDYSNYPPVNETEEQNTVKLAKEKVLQIAEQYVKEFLPSSVHEYSKVIYEPTYDEQSKTFYVSFPRIKNGLIVNGDSLSLSIDNDGKLRSFYRSESIVDVWPDVSNVISKEKAQETFAKELNAKLVYNQLNNQNDYKLFYIPTVRNEEYYQIDAITGEINNQYVNANPNPVKISHPTAENELNYLIRAGAIEVKDASAFNADIAITKGQALNTLVKSISYFYDGYYGRTSEEPPVSFDNIDSSHPYYKVVEMATNMGILNPETDQLAIDDKITREELAVWYIRALGLDQAAKNPGIYQLTISDKAQVDPSKAGYVAVAQSLGLLKLEQSAFNPKKEVTYAQLATSIIDLAYAIAEKQNNRYY